MALTVSFYDVMFGLIAGLAVLSIICLAAMRGERALLWLALALIIGAVEMQVVKLGPSFARTAAISMFIPLAHWCFTQAIRSTLRLGLSPRWLNRSAFLLTAGSLLLLLLDADDLLQTIPFQIAAVLALGNGIVCLHRKRRNLLDAALLAIQGLMTLMLLMRVPLLPVIMGGSSPFTDWSRSFILSEILALWAIIGPASVALLIGKVVASMVEAYRWRAERDDLTGLLNRTAFEEAAGTMAPAYLILCDIDHFKTVNDRYGHPVGDKVIRHMGQLLAKEDGRAARIGGEEFALLLPGVSEEDAVQRADAIRLAFRNIRIDGIPREQTLTASFGVAALHSGMTLGTVSSHADLALYSAKESGRNRVMLFGKDSSISRPEVLRAARAAA